MKRAILSLMIVLSVTAACAQKKNVNKARNLALSEVPDFKAAREHIQEALKDPTTMDDPRTWHIAGLIGYKENEELYKQMAMGKDIPMTQKGAVVMESLNYFLKAYDLDQNQVNKKGKPVKPKFERDIREKLKEYYEDPYNLFFYAAVLFDEESNYEGAMKVFDTYLAIPEYPFMENVLTKDSTYFQAKYFNAIAARNADNWERAIELHESMKHDNYETDNVYKLLAEEYSEVKDTVSFVRTLEEGFELMPNDPWFIQNLINHYITTNRVDESKAYLDKAIAATPDEPVYYFIYGEINRTGGDFEKAREYYDKTISLDPEYADAYSGIGIIIIDEAQLVLDAAAYESDAVYHKARLKSEDMYREAIKHFKKADEINPDELLYKRNLKNLYYRLNMSKELEEVDKALGY